MGLVADPYRGLMGEVLECFWVDVVWDIRGCELGPLAKLGRQRELPVELNAPQLWKGGTDPGGPLCS